MTKLKKRGFTLIELIAVLVIMAILALIVTPLVMNIIRKARIAADKRSIDAYGRSIELAIAEYLLDTGKFPTSVGELSIEYSGDKVICSTTQLNDDSSVYLTGCTVKGRTVDYAYGEDKTPQEPATPTYKAYSISEDENDTVTYNNEEYYVIENSDTTQSTVTLLKAEPLSYSEVQRYSSGTEARIYDDNGYGRIQYHASSSAYEGSYVKTTIDAWKDAKASDSLGARLITKNELEDNLGYVLNENQTYYVEYIPSAITPSWVYNIGNSYWYWTMSLDTSSSSEVWSVSSSGSMTLAGVTGKDNRGVTDRGFHGLVRPVIVLSKSLISND